MKEIFNKYIDTFKVVRIKMINKIEFEKKINSMELIDLYYLNVRV